MSNPVLKIGNVYTWLLTTDKQLKTFLHDRLRFRPKDFWHNQAYIRKRWDGWKDFFDDKSGKFLTGLLPEVQAALRVKGVEYSVLDERELIEWQHESVAPDFLNQWLPPNEDPITLHDFQPDLAAQCFKYNRGIVTAPTAAGKTLILVTLLKSLPPKTPTLFLTKSASLVHQNWEEMTHWGVENLGRWYDKFKEPNYVICATAHTKTLASLEKLLPKFKVLLVDEVHECMSDVPIAAYRKMTSACVRIGFSATAFRWDKKKTDNVHKWSAKGHYGPLFKTTTTKSGLLTTKELQDRGILSNDQCFFYNVRQPTTLAYEPYEGAIKLGIEQNFFFHETVARLVKSCPGRTLVVVGRIEQGEYLKQLIPGSEFIQGETKLKDRIPALQALKGGSKFTAIVMRQIITAGINIKIHDLINAAGGEAAHNAIQLIGRGLRLAKDKDLLRYHDFMFLINDYLKEHSEWRAEMLQREGHPVTIKDIDF
jgi:superfamily II DNA or RNA helicase